MLHRGIYLIYLLSGKFKCEGKIVEFHGRQFSIMLHNTSVKDKQEENKIFDLNFVFWFVLTTFRSLEK